ncbi:MAG: N-acetyltransferase [Phaeodactylibacter sp.]|nr:N-acetyltransferase [Phaeodactylibacter sp.]
MEITTKSLDIRQDTANEKFHFDMKGGEEVYIKYKLHTNANPNVMEFTETYVPEVLKGIGIPDVMALKAVRFADKVGYRIRTSCPFMSGFLNRHPEFSHLRAN